MSREEPNRRNKSVDEGRSEDVYKKEKLEMQPYYHGIREKEDILLELQKKGDFIVRARAFQDTARIILNVMGDKGPWNVGFDWIPEEKKYILHMAREFPDHPSSENIVDLINFYRKHPIPDGPRLKYGVPRPKWLLRQQNMEYSPEKDLLGTGNFCSVFRGVLSCDGSRRMIAIKVTHPPDADTKREDLQEAVHSMLYEAKIMSNYHHDNVIEFLGVFCDHLPIRIALEFCAGGALDGHLQKHTILPLELTLYAFEAARGMRYLHTQKCIHRDLAARNCLISSKGTIKIADFGLSKIADDYQKLEKALKHIPLRWMAPESIKKPPQYLTNSDVWSYGVLLFELYSKGVAVFADEKDYKTIAKAIRSVKMPDFPENTPEVIAKLVKEDIWCKEPEKRMLFTEIVPILYHFLEENLSQFPSDITTMAVNQIKGVRRTDIFYGSKEELLKPEKPLPKTKKRLKRREKSQEKEGNEVRESRASGNKSQNKSHRQNVSQDRGRKKKLTQNGERVSGHESNLTKKTSRLRSIGRIVPRFGASRMSDQKEDQGQGHPSRLFGRKKKSEEEKNVSQHSSNNISSLTGSKERSKEP